MMASYLLYFAIFQYVLLLFALKYEPETRKISLNTTGTDADPNQRT